MHVSRVYHLGTTTKYPYSYMCDVRCTMLLRYNACNAFVFVCCCVYTIVHYNVVATQIYTCCAGGKGENVPCRQMVHQFLHNSCPPITKSQFKKNNQCGVAVVGIGAFRGKGVGMVGTCKLQRRWLDIVLTLTII